MRLQAKDLKALLRAGRLNYAVSLIVLGVLVALGPLILKSEGFFSSNPLAPLATGAMAKFAFKHAGEAAPSVAFEGPEGELTLARLRGRPVLVNLWASWCVPCVEELPSLDRLQAALASQGLAVIAINMDQERDDALYFLGRNRIRHLPLYSDPHLLMSIALQEEGVPVSVLYNAAGREIGRYIGATNWDSKEARALILAAIHPPTNH